MSQYYENNHRTFTSGSTLARYLRVKTPAAVVVAGAGDRELGVVSAAVTVSGDPADVILNTANGTVPMVASGAVTAGATVYGDAAGKVTATANDNPIGLALQAASADGDVIEVQRHAGAQKGKLYTATAASAAVTNTTTETLFDKQFSLPANYVAAGDRLRIRFQGIATATNSTDTLAIKLYIGGLTGTALVSLAARDVANSDIFTGEAEVTFRTVGASGTFVAVGTQTASPNATGTAVVTNFTASTAIDTTAAQVIGVSATWSVANAGNSCRLDILSIDRVAA